VTKNIKGGKEGEKNKKI